MVGARCERVHVDPDTLSRFEVQDSGLRKEEEEDELFEHQADWVAQVCEQIRVNRFALLRLPSKYCRLYETLIEPSTYPELLQESPEVASLATPGPLRTLLEAWNGVCEALCVRVTAELRARTSPQFAKLQKEQQLQTQAAGMLRISFNSSAGPHFDNGFVTFMGTGNTPGALHFSVDGLSDDSSPAGAWPPFMPCETFFEPPEKGQRDFVMLVGCKVSSPAAAEYKPLLHKVEYATLPGQPRVNVMYFLRDFALGERRESRSHLELHAFNQTLLSDSEFLPTRIWDKPVPTKHPQCLKPDCTLLSECPEESDQQSRPTTPAGTRPDHSDSQLSPDGFHSSLPGAVTDGGPL